MNIEQVSIKFLRLLADIIENSTNNLRLFIVTFHSFFKLIIVTSNRDEIRRKL